MCWNMSSDADGARFTESCPGWVVEGVCTGCKEQHAHRLLERDLGGEPEEGQTYEGLCPSCGSFYPFNITGIYQEVAEPVLGFNSKRVELP